MQKYEKKKGKRSTKTKLERSKIEEENDAKDNRRKDVEDVQERG
jgi:hypothetical protein